MNRIYKRLIIHRGHEKKPGKILLRRQNFLDGGADWPAGLARAMTKFFEQVFYVITVSDNDMIEEDIKYNNATMKIINKKDFHTYSNNCDIFFKRANTDWIPPQKPLTIYYGASSCVLPKHKWNIVLTSDRSCVKSNVSYWIKGCSTDFWNAEPDIEKIYDFIVVGRSQKNISLVHQISRLFPKKNILMVGWQKSPIKNKNIKSVGRLLPQDVRTMIQKSKWGLICTCPGGEGYPMQTQLNYSLCGLPYVYDEQFKIDQYYSNENTCISLKQFDFSKWKEMSQTSLKYAHKYMTSDIAAQSLMKIIQKDGK